MTHRGLWRVTLQEAPVSLEPTDKVSLLLAEEHEPHQRPHAPDPAMQMRVWSLRSGLLLRPISELHPDAAGLHAGGHNGRQGTCVQPPTAFNGDTLLYRQAVSSQDGPTQEGTHSKRYQARRYTHAGKHAHTSRKTRGRRGRFGERGGERITGPNL